MKFIKLTYKSSKMMEFYHFYVNSLIWLKIITMMKTHHCGKNSSFWCKFITAVEIDHFDISSSLLYWLSNFRVIIVCHGAKFLMIKKLERSTFIWQTQCYVDVLRSSFIHTFSLCRVWSTRPYYVWRKIEVALMCAV